MARDSQGARKGPKHKPRTPWVRMMTRLRWAARRSRARDGGDVTERMLKVQAELEEARRLDGSSPGVER